jgi:hypothetical protein
VKPLRLLAALALVLGAAGPVWAFPVSIDPGEQDVQALSPYDLAEKALRDHAAGKITPL